MDNKFLRSTLISVEWLQKIILPYWPSPSKYVKKSPNEIGHFDKTWSYFLKALSLLRSHAYCFFEVHSGLDFQNKVHHPKENSICRSCYFFICLDHCAYEVVMCAAFSKKVILITTTNHYDSGEKWNFLYSLKMAMHYIRFTKVFDLYYSASPGGRFWSGRKKNCSCLLRES